MAAMKTALAAMCVLSLIAVAFLSVSLIVLRPPRANYPVWFTLAAFCAIQGGLTLVALSAGALSTALRVGVLAGGAVLAALGVWMVRGTLTSAHFEGYALVLGSMLVVQGALTLGGFFRWRDFRTA